MKRTQDKNTLPPPPIVWPTYSNKELDDFAVFLEGFKEEKEVYVYKMVEEKVLDAEGNQKVDAELKPMFESIRVSEKKKVQIINLDEAMVAFGAMVKEKSNGRQYYCVVVKPNKTDIHNRPIGYEFPNKYMLFNHKRKALYDRNFKKEYAGKKQLENYQDMMDKEDEIDVLKLFPTDEKNEIKSDEAPLS